jgi:hypothetical protein
VRVEVAAVDEAAVHEAPPRAIPSADGADPSGASAQLEGAVRLMREQGDGLLEVAGARVVEVDVAGVAAIARVAGEFEKADLAEVSVGMVVLRPQKRVVWVGEVLS